MNYFSMYKKIYMCKETAFKYNKYTENVIPIEDNQNRIKMIFICWKLMKLDLTSTMIFISQNINELSEYLNLKT